MSQFRSFGWKSGSVLSGPISDIWQLGNLDRDTRNPSIPNLPLGTRAPFVNSTLGSVVRVLALCSVIAVPNLLTSTLAPAQAQALPVGAQSLGFTPQYHWGITDTTQDTPLTLLSAVTPPVVVTPGVAPQSAFWLPADTSSESAKALIADAQAPNNASALAHQSPPKYLWLPADTSESSAKTLIADAQAPAGVQQTTSAPAQARVFSDTTSGVPKGLTPDGQTPVNSFSHQPPAKYPGLLADTGTTPALALRTIVSAPVVVAPVPGVQRALWLPADTSLGTAKALRAEPNTDVLRGPLFTNQRQVVPVLEVRDTTRGTLLPQLDVVVVALPPGAATPVRVVPVPRNLGDDTSAGTPKTLVTDARLPVGLDQITSAPAQPRIFSETSLGTPKALRVEQLPAGADQLASAPVQPRIYSETSLGSAKALTADAQLPVGVEQVGSAPAQFRVFSETSQGTPKGLVADAQLPVGSAQLASAPAQARVFPGTEASTPKGLIGDAQAPVGDQQLASAPHQPRLLSDTGAGTSAGLVAAAVAPFTPAPHLAPTQKTAWLVSETTRGTPKALLGDAQLPVGEDQVGSAPAQFRVFSETSASTPKSLILDAQAPVGEQQITSAPYQPRALLETGIGTSSGLRDAAVPFVPPVHFAPTQKTAWLVSETTRGTPKGLLADAQLPVGAAQLASAPHQPRVLFDSDTGTSNALRSAVVPPFTPPPHFAPTQKTAWLVSETTRGTPKGLLADAQLPVGAKQLTSAPHQPRIVSDTTAGTPKSLVADAQLPIGAKQLASAPHQPRLLSDTGSGTDVGLRVAAIAPFVPAPHFSPTQKTAWAISETTRGTPKTLTADAQLPVAVQPVLRTPERRGPLVDTSQGTGVGLRAAVAPFFTLNTPTPARPLELTDTSRGMAAVLRAAPFSNAPFIPVVRRFEPVDTSHGSPKTLLADRQAPVFVAPGFAPDARYARRWLAPETSQGLPLPLRSVIVFASVNVTEADDTVSAAATVLVKATSTLTEADDTVAAQAAVTVKAAANLTEAGDTVSAAAIVRVAASVNDTDGDDTSAAAAATVLVKASVNLTEGNDTVSAKLEVLPAFYAITHPDTIVVDGVDLTAVACQLPTPVIDQTWVTVVVDELDVTMVKCLPDTILVDKHEIS